MGLPLPLATCLSWVGPPSNLGGGECARCVPSSQSVKQNNSHNQRDQRFPPLKILRETTQREILHLRARDFPTERVLSRTRLIIDPRF